MLVGPCLGPFYILRTKEGYSLLMKFKGRFWGCFFFFLTVLGMGPGTLLSRELGSTSEPCSQAWDSFNWEAEVKGDWYNLHCEEIVPVAQGCLWKGGSVSPER